MKKRSILFFTIALLISYSSLFAMANNQITRINPQTGKTEQAEITQALDAQGNQITIIKWIPLAASANQPQSWAPTLAPIAEEDEPANN